MEDLKVKLLSDIKLLKNILENEENLKIKDITNTAIVSLIEAHLLPNLKKLSDLLVNHNG